MRYALTQIPRGDAGTAVTLRKMASLVNQSIAKPVVRGTAVNIVRSVVPRDRRGQVQAIRQFLAERVQFVRDPVGVELLHAPDFLLRDVATRYYASADCDDVAMLGAALGKSVGLRARFIAVAFYDPVAPYSHVWAELFDGDRWGELDVTRTVQNLSSKGISRRKVYSV